MLVAYFVMIFLSQDLSQKVSFSTHIPGRVDLDPYLLYIVLSSNTDKCSVSPHPPLGIIWSYQ